jgi:hypothetical protein
MRKVAVTFPDTLFQLSIVFLGLSFLCAIWMLVPVALAILITVVTVTAFTSMLVVSCNVRSMRKSISRVAREEYRVTQESYIRSSEATGEPNSLHQ